MANVSMLCHPETPAHHVAGVEVAYEIRPGGLLALRYAVDCDPGGLIVPGYAKGSERADGLWQTTCFELFARRAADQPYLEFNFSPSTQWAAYRFESYRHGMRDWSTIAPEIGVERNRISLALETMVALPDFSDEPLDIALSAVIHEIGGIKSYWALAHPPGNPDFHHPDCFALHLPASAQP